LPRQQQRPQWSETGAPHFGIVAAIVPSDTCTPVRIAESQIADAGKMMGRAFSGDPIADHVYLPQAGRERALAACCTWLVRFSYLFADVYATPNVLDGLLILQRTPVELTDQRLLESGFYDLPTTIGAAQAERFNSEFPRIVSHAEAALHEATAPGGWYLDQLAVDPARQGGGVGGGLVQWLNSLADAAGTTVSLLTFQPRNVRFYARHGYAVICEGTEPLSGVRYWGFERKPSQRSR
jgi:GNAT superfamily N-acetyltransferase